jgi:hypothetical protein
MNKMKMPRFSAEASIYPASQHLSRPAVDVRTGVKGQIVTPQYVPPYGLYPSQRVVCWPHFDVDYTGHVRVSYHCAGL